jgi:hypothetical protein
VIIPGRFCGPPGAANGGVVAATLAGDGPAEVTIRRPVPVDVELRRDGGRLLDASGTVLAEARPVPPLELDAPRLDAAAARAAAARQALGADHPFPGCFGCGPEHPSGLHCLAGPAGDGLFAVTFTPESDDLRLVWAALDCPSAMPHLHADPTTPIVLGRIAGQIVAPATPGREHVVVAWADGPAEGRRRPSRSAVLDPDGRPIAVARSTWVALPA